MPQIIGRPIWNAPANAVPRTASDTIQKNHHDAIR